MFTKNRILFLLGAWVTLVPFLGFPSSLKSFFIIVSGLLTIFIAFLLSRQKRIDAGVRSETAAKDIVTDVYAQNQPLVSPRFSQDEKFTDLNAIKEHSRSIRS